MNVIKLGGASVCNSEGVLNILNIISQYPQAVIVVSAMGKTTNALETITAYYYDKKNSKMMKSLDQLYQYHYFIEKNLLKGSEQTELSQWRKYFKQLSQKLLTTPSFNFDFEYDQIVSFGEMISTSIVSEYLKLSKIENVFLDAKTVIRTNDDYRSGKVNWKLTEALIKETIEQCTAPYIITQGFIGSTENNIPTTLGREGSDYSAAIFSNILNVKSLTIWKDVPGVLTADPRYFSEYKKIDQLSYKETIELSYFGASVIHPKTLHPLLSKNIPLYVKNFKNIKGSGTVISNTESTEKLPPIYILKHNQVLLSISIKDKSFIDESSIGIIYKIFTQFNIKINMVQQSALEVSFAFSYSDRSFNQLLETLQQYFEVKYNLDLSLLTIRHHGNKYINLESIKGKTHYLKQESRSNLRVLYKK